MKIDVSYNDFESNEDLIYMYEQIRYKWGFSEKDIEFTVDGKSVVFDYVNKIRSKGEGKYIIKRIGDTYYDYY